MLPTCAFHAMKWHLLVAFLSRIICKYCSLLKFHLWFRNLPFSPQVWPPAEMSRVCSSAQFKLRPRLWTSAALKTHKTNHRDFLLFREQFLPQLYQIQPSLASSLSQVRTRHTFRERKERNVLMLLFYVITKQCRYEVISERKIYVIRQEKISSICPTRGNSKSYNTL